jgi:hypothetical protein
LAEGLGRRQLDMVWRQDLDFAQVGYERLQGAAVVVTTPLRRSEEGIEAGADVVKPRPS